MKDNEKLDFNQEMAGIIIAIIKSSLGEEFKTWKDFNNDMKEENKQKLKTDLKDKLS